MAEVISIRFRGGSKNYYFDPQGLQVEEMICRGKGEHKEYGDRVIKEVLENCKVR